MSAQPTDHDVIGTDVFVMTFDANTGATALLPYSPVIVAGSLWRFLRPAPPRERGRS